MTFIKFIWIPLYLLAALIDHFASGFPFMKSLVVVLPAFIVVLIPAFIFFLIFILYEKQVGLVPCF